MMCANVWSRGIGALREFINCRYILCRGSMYDWIDLKVIDLKAMSAI